SRRRVAASHPQGCPRRLTMVLTSERDRDVLRSFARRIDPSDAGAHNNLGVLYYNKGLYEEAVAALMKALELDGKMQVARRNLENHDALYLMGFVLGDIGRHEEAQAVTRRAIKLNPTLSRAHANLAIDQQRAAQANGNEASTKKELQVSGEGQLARYNLGLAFRSKAYYAEALREYRAAL